MERAHSTLDGVLARRRHCKASVSPPPADPSPWAELLRRTFQADVLTSPSCHGTRGVVAVVPHSTSVRARLQHLRLFPLFNVGVEWGSSCSS